MYQIKCMLQIRLQIKFIKELITSQRRSKIRYLIFKHKYSKCIYTFYILVIMFILVKTFKLVNI